jgi:hypothetical protein
MNRRLSQTNQEDMALSTQDTREEALMKIFTLLLPILATLTIGTAQAQDMNKLMEAVDTEKAAEAVDMDKAKDAVSADGVDYKKAAEAVDMEKAADAVDMEKAKAALMKKEG